MSEPIRKRMSCFLFFQLQNYCKSTLYIPSSLTFNQRLESLKSKYSIHYKEKKPSFSSSFYYHQLIENSKRCIVGLETTYRDDLELNTTYVVGQTLEGETMLLPKQLMEQANIITINEDNILEDEPIENNNHLDISDKQISVTDIMKTPYISQGNVVRCVTGSFD